MKGRRSSSSFSFLLVVALLLLCILGYTRATNVVEENEEEEAPTPFVLKLFSNASQYLAQCNDGTPAGYYIRPGNTSKWSIHLAGGFWCWDEKTCLQRQKDSIDLVSSKNWQPSLLMGGLLSSIQANNPDFYDATSVFVPYCSSDCFSGDNEATLGGSKWQFRGRRILVRLMSVLMAQHNLGDAKEILYSGCSAGGQAVVATVDFVGGLLKSVISPNINFKGFADAGWMMNVQPRKSEDLKVEQQFKESIVLWGGHPNQGCMDGNLGEEWMCYVSPYAQPYITTPILIQTQQYDQFQVWWDCCTPPFKPQDKPFVDAIRKAFSTSLSDIVRPPSSAFSSACWTHCLSEDSNLFNSITIQGVSMQQHLGDWFFDRSPPRNLIDHCNGFQCSKGCPPINMQDQKSSTLIIN